MRQPTWNVFTTDARFSDVKFSSIYVGPDTEVQGSVPLILWPHGGPHSVSLDAYNRDVDFFNKLGYGVLLASFNRSKNTKNHVKVLL